MNRFVSLALILAATSGLAVPALADTPLLAFDPDAATQAWMALIDPAQRAKSDAYYEGTYWLILWNGLMPVLVAAILMQGNRFVRWVAAVEAKIKIRFLAHCVIGVIYLLASALITLPLTIYEGFIREHAYGLSTQDFGAWAGEQLIDLAINTLIVAIGVAGIYALLRRVRQLWWVWASGFAIAMMALIVAISPVFIAPLFNKYEPMKEGELKTAILQMAEANGVPASNVYTFDTSRQSTRVTANVSGLFGTTRISLGDNLLTRMSPDAVKGVMAHEIGHYTLFHLGSIMTMYALALFIIFILTDKLFERLTRNGRLGGGPIENIATLPVFGAVISLIFMLATPVFNNITRYHETQADIFGLNAGRAPDGFAEAALALAEYRKLEPGPVERFIFFHHPSGYDRVKMSMQWKAAEIAAGRYPASPGGPPPGFKIRMGKDDAPASPAAPTEDKAGKPE